MAFARRGLNDRHYFRFVVTPEDVAEMTHLKAFTRDLVGHMKNDLGTRLDWVGIAQRQRLHRPAAGRGRSGDAPSRPQLVAQALPVVLAYPHSA
jgi:hypothetical protein